MNRVANLHADDRRDLFSETSARMGLASVLAEKDFWVCWVLYRVFSIREKLPGLVFKGGTSLSKVFHIIERFSEDIDLSLDRHDLGFGGERDPANAPSQSKAKTLIKELTAQAKEFIANDLRTALTEDFQQALPDPGGGWELDVEKPNSETLVFAYPRALDAGDYGAAQYIRPAVRIELGARSDHWPATDYPVTPYAAEQFPQEFEVRSCQARTIEVERTFWEKATILHAEYHRPPRTLQQGLSRHYYDLMMLGRSNARDQALNRLDLLEQVAKHKARFFPAAWANYGDAVPGKMKLVPGGELERKLRKDYDNMQIMIFSEPPSFDSILDAVRQLETDINSLG